MSERREHWDDALIDAVFRIMDNYAAEVWRRVVDHGTPTFDIIAAVEDWQAQHEIVSAPAVLIGAVQRAAIAEAAIQRVRDVCDLWQRRHDTSIRHPTAIAAIPITAVLRALEGDDDE